MKFWPWIRESAITLWHMMLEYDRKIPAAKREMQRAERHEKKLARLAKDTILENRIAVKRAMKAKEEQERKLAEASKKATQKSVAPKYDQSVSKPTKKHSADFTHWPNTGDFYFDVVGEINYQKAICRLAGGHDEDGAETECVATLVCEDNNKFDSKAVAVKIQGLTVGYLSKDDARSFRRRLGQKGLSGRETTCGALIKGGFKKKNGEKAHYGVSLDIKPFE